MSLRGIALLAVCALLCAPPAWAGDGGSEEDALLERAATLTQAVAEHKKARNLSALEGDLREAVKLYEATPEESDDRKVAKIRSDTVKLVGGLLSIQDRAHRLACFDALGQMGDKDGARYLKRWLKPVTGKTIDPLLQPALETAGEICCKRLVPPLLGIVERSKHASVKVLAMNALANFGHCKKYREKILVDLVKHVKRYRPGVTRLKENKVDPNKGPIGNRTGEGTVSDWQALASALPGVLNKLTGSNIADAEDWICIVEENKRNLSALFQLEVEADD